MGVVGAGADARARKPVGRITRGTTGTNRLRRVDRFIAALPELRHAADPLVVDLGHGASATTPLELHARLARVRPDVEVLGLEIDPERVRVASLSARPGVSFALGGFEVPVAAGRRPAVIRAFNVLRQYNETEVPDAWARMLARLAPGGVLVEGTCSEVGRVASWVTLRAGGGSADLGSPVPDSLTIALRASGLEAPSIVAERLPKALIHRNVPGERIHDLLLELDRCWAAAAPISVYGPTQRWIATVEALRGGSGGGGPSGAGGWPVLGGRSRWRLGELTVPWDSVAPR